MLDLLDEEKYIGVYILPCKAFLQKQIVFYFCALILYEKHGEYTYNVYLLQGSNQSRMMQKQIVVSSRAEIKVKIAGNASVSGDIHGPTCDNSKYW